MAKTIVGKTYYGTSSINYEVTPKRSIRLFGERFGKRVPDGWELRLITPPFFPSSEVQNLRKAENDKWIQRINDVKNGIRGDLSLMSVVAKMLFERHLDGGQGPPWEVVADGIRDLFGIDDIEGYHRCLTGTQKFTYEREQYDTTFKIGDLAEYGSYNIHYIGRIVSIAPKTITIDHDLGQYVPKTRLTIEKFAHKNYNDIEEKIMSNRSFQD